MNPQRDIDRLAGFLVGFLLLLGAFIAHGQPDQEDADGESAQVISDLKR